MSRTDDRLRRLVADEVGECRDADVAERADRLLAALPRRVPLRDARRDAGRSRLAIPFGGDLR